MTSDSFKRWYIVHKWTSLICTLFLLLLCLTGLPLVFADELAVLLGEAAEPPDEADSRAPVVLDALIQDAKARRPNDQVKFLARDDDGPAWFVSMGATLVSPDNTATFMYDSRTGTFLHEQGGDAGVVRFLFKLHVELLAGLPGTLFLGGMGLLFVASVLSGIVVYGPFMRKLPFGAVRRDGSARLLWLDLHNLLGISTALWAFVVGLTGVISTLDRPLLGYWQMTEVMAMTAPWKDKLRPTALAPVDDVVSSAEAEAPDMLVRFVAFPGTSFASPHHYMVFMRGQEPLTARLLKPVLVEAETGRAIATKEIPWYLTTLLVSQPLHFGDYGGLPLKIIWALLDVITIIILVSGIALWWKKHHVQEDPFFPDPSEWLSETGRQLEAPEVRRA
jgi:uncharacterized iron-regulated membrane protein